MIAPAIEQVFQTHIQPLKRDEQLQLIERISQSLRQSDSNGASLTAQTNAPAKPRAVFGSGKGDIILYIAPDFDAPMEEFAEYM
ncbi:MAG: hypothetical protein H7Y38_13115 [Armatimonadetes bacterium]|nr:hypothetical protein [Armatimonadota bacterium]